MPRGERGEICVKGPTLMLGYVGTPLDETLDAEGFFHTGDGGYLDDAGRLFWEGRLTDIIKTGGANVSPLEVDEALAGYPGVKVAQTVGVPHETLGEVVVACIVPHDGASLEPRGSAHSCGSDWRATRCRAMCCSSTRTRSRSRAARRSSPATFVSWPPSGSHG